MKTLAEATVNDLKVAAFDTNQQIIQLQQNYKVIMEELIRRQQEAPESPKASETATGKPKK